MQRLPNGKEFQDNSRNEIEMLFFFQYLNKDNSINLINHMAPYKTYRLLTMINIIKLKPHCTQSRNLAPYRFFFKGRLHNL